MMSRASEGGTARCFWWMLESGEKVGVGGKGRREGAEVVRSGPEEEEGKEGTNSSTFFRLLPPPSSAEGAA